MPLVRGDEAKWVLHDGGELECVSCHHLYTLDDEYELRSRIGDYSCPGCGCEGFIPHRRSDHKIADRFPDQLGQAFVPVVHELLEHGGDFGVKAKHRMVIVALERHRFRADDVVWPSIERIANLAGLSPATASRAIADLVDRGLLTRESGRDRGVAGRYASTTYDLSPLWKAIAAVAAKKEIGHDSP